MSPEELRRERGPLVTIGIPSYQRASLLGQAIDSAVVQTYRNLEIVVADNASTDGSADVAARVAERDPRLSLIRQPVNLGATANFAAVLNAAKGEFFLWLGDDDWLEPDYVEKCVSLLLADANISLCGGMPVYHWEDRVEQGNLQRVVNQYPLLRMACYLSAVADNGLFYGVIRRDRIDSTLIRPAMGWDWILLSHLAFQGHLEMTGETRIHRRMGGATQSYKRIVEVLSLPEWNAKFPFLAITITLARELVSSKRAFAGLTPLRRLRYAAVLSAVVIYRKSLPGVRVRLRGIARGLVARAKRAGSRDRYENKSPRASL